MSAPAPQTNTGGTNGGTGGAAQRARRPVQPGWDALLLAVLVLAVVQITGLAEQAALPTRLQDVLRHPLLGALVPAAGVTAMGDIGPRPGDPVGILLVAITVGLLLLYLVLDLALRDPARTRWKAVVLAGILITAVALPTGKLILLRQGSGPASYSHDGGVIQTEATIRFLLEGKNPYVEDYTQTPMAEWGFSRYRTALYHYPYLPWTFVFSAPFYVAGQAAGLFDERMVYLLLWVVMLALAPRLVAGPRRKLALVAMLGLNPIMALDVIFGQNDVFVLAWIVLALVAWKSWWDGRAAGQASRRGGLLLLSAVCYGLACAAKPTAWFLAPFYGLLLVADSPAVGYGWAGVRQVMPALLRRALPALLAFGVLLVPYVLWDAPALYDDVWRWSTGQGETGYQIWGWGASNFVLAFGLVADRFAYWPFWMPELIVAGPLLAWLLWRQWRANTLSNACWHYALLLFGFTYVSRFLNENYLGFILALLAIGVLSAGPEDADEGRSPASGMIPG